MVLVHLPVPHLPAIYDRARGATTLTNMHELEGYFDNVALADRSLAELRRAMEQAGTWETRHVIVTADHPLRGARRWYSDRGRHVPFLVKLAHVNRAMTYSGDFDTIRLRDLTSALLRGTIVDVDQLRQWIEDARR